MKSEPTLVGEDVHRFAVGVLRCGGVVFSLVEEGASLLSRECVEIETHPIERNLCFRFRAREEPGTSLWQLLQLPNPILDTFHHRRGLNGCLNSRKECRAEPLLVSGLREKLNRH